jgi:UV DNA damage repair endonuclease
MRIALNEGGKKKKRKNFCEKIRTEMDNDEETVAQRLVLNDEATYHTNGKVGLCYACVKYQK